MNGKIKPKKVTFGADAARVAGPAPNTNLPSLSLPSSNRGQEERYSLTGSHYKEEPDEGKLSCPVLEDQPKG